LPAPGGSGRPAPQRWEPNMGAKLTTASGGSRTESHRPSFAGRSADDGPNRPSYERAVGAAPAGPPSA
jgi:hypothetical protein